MKLLLVSGDGQGAGKTFAAAKMSDVTWSLAQQIRNELSTQLPHYQWHRKDQEYKNGTEVKEWNYKTVREVLFEYGQQKCVGDPEYWVKRLAENLGYARHIADGVRTIGVDDVRKMCELRYLRERFNCFHVHVANPDAIVEPQFQADELRAAADYVITWKK